MWLLEVLIRDPSQIGFMKIVLGLTLLLVCQSIKEERCLVCMFFERSSSKITKMKMPLLSCADSLL